MASGWKHVTTGEISQFMVNPPSKVLIFTTSNGSYLGHQILDIGSIKNFDPSCKGVGFTFWWSSNCFAYGLWQSSPTVEFFYAGMSGYTISIYKK